MNLLSEPVFEGLTDVELSEMFKQGSKGYLVARELVGLQHIPSTDERKSICNTYSIQSSYLNNILGKLRKNTSLGTGIKTGHKTVDTIKVSLDTQNSYKKGEVYTPSIKQVQNDTETYTGDIQTPSEPPLKTESHHIDSPSLPPTNISKNTIQSEDIDETSLPVYDNRLLKLEDAMGKIVEYITGSKNNGEDQETAPSQPEEPPQIMKYPRDLLIKKTVWCIPKILTLYQIYVEDSSKKGKTAFNFSEWINHSILTPYKDRGMDLVLAMPPRQISTGLYEN